MMRRALRLGPILTLLFGGPAATGCGDESPLISNDGDMEICGLVRPDGQRYCIDMFEASRSDADDMSPGVDNAGPARSLPDRLPWVDVSWSAARAACEARDARLCETEEWVDACDGMTGAGGNTFTYGDTRNPELCTLDGLGVRISGSKDTCEATTGTFDQSGNVWEWSGNTVGAAAARGGGFRSSQTHRCADIRPSVAITEVDVDLGFRCCRPI